MPFEIKTITAYVAVDKDGEEGIIAHMQNGIWLPLVCADETRAKQMYPLAVQACAIDNKQFKVLRFAVREDITEQIIKQYGGK